MVRLAKEIADNSYFKLHAEGNYYETEIEELYKNLTETFKSKQSGGNIEIEQPELFLYPERKYYVKVKNLNPKSKESAIMVHWQLPVLTEEEKFQIELIMQMMGPPLFKYLRTDKNLGYRIGKGFPEYYRIMTQNSLQ